MNENLFLKQNTITGTSDDSYSFPWFPENVQRRKSRLGTHRNQARILKNLDSNDLAKINYEKSVPHFPKGSELVSNELISAQNEDLSSEDKSHLKNNNFQKNRASSENVILDSLNSIDISSPIEDIVWRNDLKPMDYSPVLNKITPVKDLKSSYHTSAEDFIINECKSDKHGFIPFEKSVEKQNTSAEEFVTVNEYKQIGDDNISTQDLMSIDEFEPLNYNISSPEKKLISLNDNTSPENIVNTNDSNFLNHYSVSAGNNKEIIQDSKPVNHHKSSEIISKINIYMQTDNENNLINASKSIMVHKTSDHENALLTACESFNHLLASPKEILSESKVKKKCNIEPSSKNNSNNKNNVLSKPGVHFAESLPSAAEKPTGSRHFSKLPSQIMVKNKSYEVRKVLGKGGSSVVYEVLESETNKSFAIKRVKLTHTDESIAQGYLDEVKMLENLQSCDFIIKIVDHEMVCENDKKLLYVVMEKGDTDLSELIRDVSKTQKLFIPEIVYYWSAMLSAVKEIHSKGIIHSDLKPANFVLVRGRLKLIDFGIASSVQGDMTSVYKDVFTGTLNYMSPEAVNFVQCPTGPNAGYRITYKTDVWSLGCILYNLIYGTLPFKHINNKMEKMFAIVNPNVNVKFPEIGDIPFVLIDSLKLCLIKDAKKRPTVSQLLDRILNVYTTNKT